MHVHRSKIPLLISSLLNASSYFIAELEGDWCLAFAYNFGWEHENLLAWQKYVFIPEKVETGLTFEPWFYTIVLQGVLCIMICYVF